MTKPIHPAGTTCVRLLAELRRVTRAPWGFRMILLAAYTMAISGIALGVFLAGLLDDVFGFWWPRPRM